MPRVDFYTDQYDILIEQKGMKILWEQAMMCWCVDDDGQPNINCPICGGSGYMYDVPVETRVATTSLSGKIDYSELGALEKGTAYMTSKSTDLMGFHDRITFVDFNSKYSQQIKFIDGKSSRLHLPAKKVLRLLDPMAVYEPDVDFEIDPDNAFALRWINPSTWPVDGTKMPILYTSAPSYCIIDVIHELRAVYNKMHEAEETFKELPKQFLIRREGFIYDTSGNGLITN